MSVLARFRITTKILSVIAILGLVAVVISGVAVSSLGSLSRAAETMNTYSERALLAARLNASMLAVGREQYRLVSDPRPQARDVAKAALEQELALLEERLGQLESVATAQEREALAPVRADVIAYQRGLETVFAAAAAVTGVDSSAEMEALRRAAQANSLVADDLRKQARAFSDQLSDRVEAASMAVTAEYHASATIIVAVAAIGIAMGLAIGAAIAHLGIGKPLRTIVEVLKRLANAEYQIAVPGTERGDEVGDVARAALTFKENGLEAERLRAETADQQVARERRQRTIEAAIASFEKASERVTATLGKSSAELSESARAMSATAEETTNQATAVAAASEQAASNVENVAASSTELASTLQEVGRQVSETAKLAGGAADQAGVTVEKVERLTDAAQRIGDIVGLIQQIAEQTNLLALNARSRRPAPARPARGSPSSQRR